MTNPTFNNTIWLDKWLDPETNKIKIPANCTQLKLDVGLAGDAPNSAIWLSETLDRFVIGFEPLEYHWKHLTRLGSPDDNEDLTHPEWKILQMEDFSIKQNRQKLVDIRDRFLPLHTAINNVKEPGTQTFFMNKVGETGASSLRFPTDRPHLVDKEVQVNVCSLEYILNHVPWDRFEFVEHIKTDCEGLDMDVVASLGPYLSKVVFITSETAHYNNAKIEEFFKFMFDHGFEVLTHGGGNADFINWSYLPQIKKYRLSNHTLGL